MLQLFSAVNRVSMEVRPSLPWEFDPPKDALLASISGKTHKTRRDKVMTRSDTEWDVYSVARGANPHQRVASKTNPVVALVGLALDIDEPLPTDEVIRRVETTKSPELRPNFLERTLSGNARLLFVFEKELPVNGSAAARSFATEFFKAAGLAKPSTFDFYDKKSVEPEQVWTNGGDWTLLREEPVPYDAIVGVAMQAWKGDGGAVCEIPLEKIAAEIERRWPGKWQGEFAVDACGTRFWDEEADNKNGCRVKPDGFQCFTGPSPFKPWSELLGADWVNQNRALHLGQAANNAWHDGKLYWIKEDGKYTAFSKDNFIIELRGRGLSARVAKGQNLSDVEQVLRFINKNCRVSRVASMFNYQEGVVTLDGGEVVLNTCKPVAFPPADGTFTEADCPMHFTVLHSLFDTPEKFDHFISWLQRFYVSIREFKNMMGQAVFICGPKDCGKTLLSSQIIRWLVGGREADPHDYLRGKTTFNSDLLEVPLLAMNDSDPIVSEADRRAFVSRLKQITANTHHKDSKKFMDTVNRKWGGRIFATLNNNAGSLGLLPEIDISNEDKISLYEVGPRKEFWGENFEIEGKLEAERPAFARWLLDWKVPDYVKSHSRAGIKSFHSPNMLEHSKHARKCCDFNELIRRWLFLVREFPLDEGDTVTTNDTWVGDPTKLLANVSVCDGLGKALAKWDTHSIYVALSTCINQKFPGYYAAPEAGSRHFRLERAEIMSGKSPEA